MYQMGRGIHFPKECTDEEQLYKRKKTDSPNSVPSNLSNTTFPTLCVTQQPPPATTVVLRQPPPPTRVTSSILTTPSTTQIQHQPQLQIQTMVNPKAQLHQPIQHQQQKQSKHVEAQQGKDSCVKNGMSSSDSHNDLVLVSTICGQAHMMGDPKGLPEEEILELKTMEQVKSYEFLILLRNF
eukprot:TRINITY_DN8781_c0_g2_i7.p1 TRINITY_DN8781_c0_g2~~TRINITY_DN8781_c0_g2_i7.p1  ORF type:complete len:182 (-),score=31.79 TRINITY_DN8781_c0_g2_i7:154-699(-)